MNIKEVLFICSSLERTGPTNQLLNIVKYNKNIKFSILTLSVEKKDSMINDFIVLENVRLFINKDTSLLNKLKLIFKADIIHTQGIKADIFSALFFWKKNIATLRNYPYEDYPPLYGKVKGNLMAYIHLFFLKFINYRVTISDSTALKNKNKTNMDFNVIYNGVDVDKFSPEYINSTKDIKSELGIKDNKKIFIYTGPLIKRKNVKSLVDIFNDNDGYNLLVVGDGPELEILKNCSGNNIFFTGGVSNVVDYLNAADVFIMLSHSEGFPNSVMEALSVGLPCILSDIPSHQDVKNIMKDNVFIYDGSNLNTFVISNNSILSLDKEIIRNEAIMNISASKMAEKYYELYIRK